MLRNINKKDLMNHFANLVMIENSGLKDSERINLFYQELYNFLRMFGDDKMWDEMLEIVTTYIKASSQDTPQDTVQEEVKEEEVQEVIQPVVKMRKRYYK